MVADEGEFSYTSLRFCSEIDQKRFGQFISCETRNLMLNLGRLAFCPSIAMFCAGYMNSDNPRQSAGVLWLLISIGAMYTFADGYRPRHTFAFTHMLLIIVSVVPIAAVWSRKNDEIHDRHQFGTIMINVALAHVLPGQVAIMLSCDFLFYSALEVLKNAALGFALYSQHGLDASAFWLLWYPFNNIWCTYWQQLVKHKTFAHLIAPGAETSDLMSLMKDEGEPQEAAVRPTYEGIFEKAEAAMSMLTLRFHDHGMNVSHDKWATTRLYALRQWVGMMLAITALFWLAALREGHLPRKHVILTSAFYFVMASLYLMGYLRILFGYEYMLQFRIRNLACCFAMIVKALLFARALRGFLHDDPWWDRPSSHYSPTYGIPPTAVMFQCGISMAVPQHLAVFLSIEFTVCVFAVVVCSGIQVVFMYSENMIMELIAIVGVNFIQIFFVHHELLWHKLYLTCIFNLKTPGHSNESAEFQGLIGGHTGGRARDSDDSDDADAGVDMAQQQCVCPSG